MNRLTRRLSKTPQAQLIRAGAHYVSGLGWYLHAKTQIEVQGMRETERDPGFLGYRVAEAHQTLQVIYDMTIDIASKHAGHPFQSGVEAVEYIRGLKESC